MKTKKNINNVKKIIVDCLPHPFFPKSANLAFEETLNSTSAKRDDSPGQAKEALDILTNFSLL